MVRRTHVFATLACLLAAGCIGGPMGSAASPDDAPTGTFAHEEVTTSTPTTSASPADQPAHGTQFVSVERYEHRTIGTTWPPDERSTFENLTDAQQDVFLRAIEDGQQRFRPDETNPFDWNDGSRPRVVNYEGEWYHVRVAIV